MLQLTFNNNKYNVPNSWEELSEKQFLQVIAVIEDLFSGKINLFQFRIMMALIVTGLKPRRFRRYEREMLMSENVYRIGQSITFPLKVEYEKLQAVQKMNPEIKEQLLYLLPEELDKNIPQVKWALKQKKTIAPNFVFPANLIPKIKNQFRTLDGYQFNVDGNILTTSLTAAQFTEAQTAYSQYIETKNPAMLKLLAAILYCYGTYDGKKAMALSKTIDWVSPELLNAVFINFQAIQIFITERTKYNLLFSGKSKKVKGVNGLEAAIFSLLKSGVNNPEDMNLVKFFELLYSDLISLISELHRQEMPIDKISEKTGLSIAKINQIP